MNTTPKTTVPRRRRRPATSHRPPVTLFILLPLLLTSCPYEMPILQNPHDPSVSAAVGATGPAGGYIFYDQGDNRGGTRRLGVRRGVGTAGARRFRHR